MTPSPATPFAAPDAGADYLATDAHYTSLAGRVVAALRRGSRFVVVVGDPPPAPLTLSPVLDSAAAWWYRVVCVPCGPETSRDQLLPLPAASLLPALGTNGSAQQDKPASPLAPLFVFGDADRLSDGQIENICEALTCGEGGTAVGVLLARPAFLPRLDGAAPRLLTDGRPARLHIDRLGREEIATFIRRQLGPGDRESAFTADTITAIADAAGGDPSLVNHLSRLMLTFAEAVEGETRRRPAAEAPLRGSLGTELAAPPPAHGGRAATPQGNDRMPPARNDKLSAPESPTIAEQRVGAAPLRRRAAWRWQMGIVLCLTAGGFLLVPSKDLASLARRAHVASLVHRAESLSAMTAHRVASWTKPLFDTPAGSSERPLASNRATVLAAAQNGMPAHTDAVGPVRAGPAALPINKGVPPAPSAGSQASANIAPGGPPDRAMMAASPAAPVGSSNPESAATSGAAIAANLTADETARRPARKELGLSILPLNSAGNNLSVGHPPVATSATAAGSPAPASAPARGSLAAATPTSGMSVAATASLAAAKPEPAAAVAPTTPPISAAEIAVLVARGDALVGLGDLASARLFYARAAEAGDGGAALRIGATYDPAFLGRAGILGAPASQQQAISWYRRARNLGEAAAMQQLKSLHP